MKNVFKLFALVILASTTLSLQAQASGDPGVEQIDANAYFVHDPLDITGRGWAFVYVNGDFSKNVRDQVKARTLAQASIQCYKQFGSIDNCLIRQGSFVMAPGPFLRSDPDYQYYTATIVIQRRQGSKTPSIDQTPTMAE